jgi:uncharacterized OsmC-like protein
MRLAQRPRLLPERPARARAIAGRLVESRRAPTIDAVPDSTANAMTRRDIAASMHRAQTVLQRHPEMGLHDDAPATARWHGGTRVATRHGNGTEIASDMPAELGGTGDRITPGWLFRAGLASCATTTIAMAAIEHGIALSHLEVLARSRTDTRGMLGMADASGARVPATPQDVQLVVRIAAPGVSSQRLRALVDEGCCRSPVPSAVQGALALDVQVEDVGA